MIPTKPPAASHLVVIFSEIILEEVWPFFHEFRKMFFPQIYRSWVLSRNIEKKTVEGDDDAQKRKPPQGHRKISHKTDKFNFNAKSILYKIRCN